MPRKRRKAGVKDWKYHCAVLGVPEGADLKEVRKAYRRLALKLHPDKHDNSQKAKENFQQLNESYRHVAAALIGGYQPGATSTTASPRSAEHADRPAAPPTRPAPAPRNPGPARLPQDPAGRKFNKIWLHAAIACFALLILSILVERPIQQLPDFKPDSSELLLKNWCFVSRSENGGPLKEVAELSTQPACESRCGALASDHDVSCQWNGLEFRAFQNHAPAAAAAQAATAVDDATSPCEITVEKNSGVVSTPYRSQTESSCRTICEGLMNLSTKDGISCRWKGREFLSQALRKPAPESPRANPAHAGLPPPPPPAASVRVEDLPPTRGPRKTSVTGTDDLTKAMNPQAYADANELRSTCYKSVVSEAGANAESFDNDTARSCEARCLAEIAESPTGKEVKCAFAGKSLITYVPDPMVSYLARDPSSSGFQQADQFLASCQIFARLGERRASPKSDVTTEQACLIACKADYLRRPKGAEVVCQFNGDTIFHQTVGR